MFSERAFVLIILATILLWFPLVWRGLLLDPTVEFSYSHSSIVGRGVLSGERHLQLAARALIEEGIKIVSGRGLTVIPLAERAGLGSSLGSFGCALILLAGLALGIAIGMRSLWARVWVTVFGVSSFAYLVIPNLNIGSEHYFYFSSLGLLSMVAFGFWRLLPDRVAPLLLGVYSVVFLLISENRIVRDLASPRLLALAEMSSHPEAPMSWFLGAADLINQGTSPELAHEYLENARRIAPTNTMLFYLAFQLSLQTGRPEDMEKNLERLRNGKGPRFQIVDSDLKYAMICGAKGECEKAARAFEEAMRLDPRNLAVQQLRDAWVSDPNIGTRFKIGKCQFELTQ